MLQELYIKILEELQFLKNISKNSVKIQNQNSVNILIRVVFYKKLFNYNSVRTIIRSLEEVQSEFLKNFNKNLFCKNFNFKQNFV